MEGLALEEPGQVDCSPESALRWLVVAVWIVFFSWGNRGGFSFLFSVIFNLGFMDGMHGWGGVCCFSLREMCAARLRLPFWSATFLTSYRTVSV